MKTQSSNRILHGVMLLLIGIVALAAQFTSLGVWVLPILGILFLLWGLLSRNIGFIIPGGILSGIAIGAWAVNLPIAQTSDEMEGGMFLLGFTIGWAIISLFGLFIGERTLWPLIPGGILAVIGVALLNGGPLLKLMEYAGKLWPLALIGIGLWLLPRTQSKPQTNNK